MCKLCTVMCGRENCASACVQVGVVSTHLVALTAVATDWVRNSDAATSAEKLEQDRSQTYRLMVTTSSLSSTHAWFQLLFANVSSMLSHFTIVLSICRLATCAGSISANFESMKTNSTMLGLVTGLKMMMVAVAGSLNFAVLQIVSTNSYSIIPGTLAVKGQFCSANASCH